MSSPAPMAKQRDEARRRTIPLVEPDLSEKEQAYLLQCISDGWVSSAGPFVADLEAEFARACRRRFAVAASSGTTALHLVLVALGIGNGARVVVPDWTFAATANAVIHAGGRPVFADIDPATLTLDPGLVEQLVAVGDVAAVIAVDALGHACDFDRLTETCNRHGAALISDAAGSLGATYKGEPAGHRGRAAVFSLNGNKVVTGGGGGVIVTDDAELAARARHLSTQARLGGDYVHDEVGFNYRLTNLNAAVALAQIERLPAMVARRREIASRYDAAAVAHLFLAPLPTAEWAERNGWLHSVMANTEDDARSFVAHLAARGIEARPFWRSVSSQRPYEGYETNLTGASRSISGRIVSLPSGSRLSDDAVARVIAGIENWQPAA